MTARHPGRRSGRQSTDAADDTARKGAGDPQDSDVGRSAVATLGAPLAAALNQSEELDHLRRQGRRPDSAGGATSLESALRKASPSEKQARPGKATKAAR